MARHSRNTLKATLLAAAVATLAACSDPMGPQPVDADRPSLGGDRGSIDPDAPEYRPTAGRNTGANGGEDVTVAGGQDPIGGGFDY